MGLARSGVAAALALRARGERVVGVDAGRPDVGRLGEAGVEVHLDDPGDRLLDGVGTLVKSPGVPHSAPAVAAARARGIAVVGELEIAWRMLPNPFVAVTGTNGKTTTTELIGHIHRQAGRPVAVAGNVGTPVSALVGELPDEATIVCEASSFQLEDTIAFAPEAAVLLNVTPDHLDRHGSFAAYREAKLNAFRRQGEDACSIAPVDFDGPLPGDARRVTFGTHPDARGGPRSAAVTLRDDGMVCWQGRPFVAVDEIRLPGRHNLDNAMAAAAAALACGVPPEAVRAGLRSFRGVAHRLEPVGTVDGVAYVNDSKATNVDSTLVALRSYEPDPARRPRGRVHLIAGGRTKAQDFAPLAPLVAERCAAVYLIGEGTEEIAAALAPSGVPLHDCGELERALAAARVAARPGDVVLLSPACASFDQFADFEARGDAFRALVEGL